MLSCNAAAERPALDRLSVHPLPSDTACIHQSFQCRRVCSVIVINIKRTVMKYTLVPAVPTIDNRRSVFLDLCNKFHGKNCLQMLPFSFGDNTHLIL